MNFSFSHQHKYYHLNKNNTHKFQDLVLQLLNATIITNNDCKCILIKFLLIIDPNYLLQIIHHQISSLLKFLF